MATTFRTIPLRRVLARRVLWALLALLALPAPAPCATRTAPNLPIAVESAASPSETPAPQRSLAADCGPTLTTGPLLAASDLPLVLEAAAPGQSPAPDRDPAPERGLAPERSQISDRSAVRARHVLVKALGQGATKQEAEQQALRNARTLAAQHLAALGGAEALATGDESQRIVTMRHFPTLGFGAPRAVALVELRLRGQLAQQEPDSALLVLRASAEAGVLSLEANRPCEAVAAYLPAPEAEPEFLPGGVQLLRLSPGKPVRQPLPAGLKSLDVLACTGGLLLPADPTSLEEAFTKARPGRPRPFRVEGVVSDCVELRLPVSPSGQRSMRLKSPDSPVNMTGAAGRESGLPVSPKQ